ncbi:pentapeptide repeat-containing protein [Streptomyces sp. NPDC005773]|uniref:pentapeptide repeat-containing protein n=1 Tax=Streptomyces sp. NPDC005773 TaxID=3364727 RepID=UPI0036D16E4A
MHAAEAGRAAYFAGLIPGSSIDHRCTPFPGHLLDRLLQALHDPEAGRARIGEADFRGAEFHEAAFDRAIFSGTARLSGAEFYERASFTEVQFLGDACFDGTHFHEVVGFADAQFSRQAGFSKARFDAQATYDQVRFAGAAAFDDTQFSGTARFYGAKFDGQAMFIGARFSGSAGYTAARFSSYTSFAGAEFAGDAGFGATMFSAQVDFARVQFSGPAQFVRAEFSSDAGFGAAIFSGETEFDGARFSSAAFSGALFARTTRFGPMECAKEIDLSGSVFEVPVSLEIAAVAVRFERTRWESTATLRLRHATVNLSHAVLTNPVAVTAHPTLFNAGGGIEVREDLLRGSRSGVRVSSVRGVDAAHLVLTDIDLVDCLFAGAFHLDQLRLEGRCTFASTPTGLHRRYLICPYRWSSRRTLAEEHHWRAQVAGQPALPDGRHPSPRVWRTGPAHPSPDLTPDPEDVATLYRQLRKAFEDGKNEPGAADFYYGEMEMRRHDRVDTTTGERFLLRGYWLLSGYGLRASRAIGWLLAAMAVTIVLMLGLGLPDSSPEQVATGTVPAGGGQVTLVVGKEDARLTLPVTDRFTGERFDKAVQVVLNSVVFRTSGQDLTTWGTYTEMISRFLEPVLLALAALAIRGRIKR